MKAKNALSLVLAAGVVTPAVADVSPTVAPRGTMAEKPIAHIYYNIATGEKVATLLGDARPSDNGVSPAVWVAENTLPCASFGQTGGTSGIVDSPDCSTCFTSTATGLIFLDWADIANDQVVDCVGISWSTQVLDTDTDGDGLGDGVVGFGASWAWFDAENGFDSSATRLDLTGFTFFSLPGFTGTFDPNLLAVYTATVDLAATFSSSIVFEIGDTDSTSTTGIFNAGAGADLDSDGMADFGYAIQYIQPGTVDFDGDGNPDGDPAAAALTGWTLVTGNGDVSSDGSTYTPEASAPGDTGAEDAFDIYLDFDNDGVLEPFGTFWYGGFACDIDGNGSFEPGANSNPYSQFRMALYGPGGSVPCPADLFPAGGDGQLNFFDINTFITAFNNGDLAVADIFPAGGDGSLNFFDINTYVTQFNAGCP